MADRKAINKYYPPDWDPSKGSANKFQKSHPLRDRARKIGQGILVIRFEMPFNIWCSGCNKHVAMGVRYNAEKSKVGNYYTSPIYQFKMKCHLCDNYFVIRSEPNKFDYVIESGARRQVMTKDADEVTLNLGEGTSCQSETSRVQETRVSTAETMSEPNLRDIKDWRSRWKDDFATNQLVRSQYRITRKKLEEKHKRDQKLRKKASINIPLLTPSARDIVQARELMKRSN